MPGQIRTLLDWLDEIGIREEFESWPLLELGANLDHDITMAGIQEGGEDADRIDPLVEEITPMLERQATNSSMFKLIYGTRHGGRRLAVSDGLTSTAGGVVPAASISAS